MSLFCLVHGGFQGAWCWDLLIPHLQAQGHKAVAMDLPIDDPSATLSRYVDVVVRALPETEKDVVVVAHSLAGAFIPLIATRYPIHRLVFLAGLIPHPGMSVLDQCYDEIDLNALKATSYQLPDTSKFEQLRDEPDMYDPAFLKINPNEQSEAVAMEFLFHDCEPEVARWAISKLRNQRSLAHAFEVIPLEALPDLEYAYIVCSDDRTLSPAWSRYAARKRLGVEAIEIPGGHCPHLSRPAHLAEVLGEIASKKHL
jgi:pimeloyl-ACP methyl ester carboxylesterase